MTINRNIKGLRIGMIIVRKESDFCSGPVCVGDVLRDEHVRDDCAGRHPTLRGRRRESGPWSE